MFEDQAFLSGRCLLSISSTTTFKTAYSPAAPPTYVAMRGNMGVAPFPGSTRVLDRPTGQMVGCDETICPLAAQKAPDAVRARARARNTVVRCCGVNSGLRIQIRIQIQIEGWSQWVRES